jgi:uncharacterized membrane protein
MERSISAWQVIQPNFHLGWNIFLALIPLGLSIWLFRDNRQRDLVWWVGIAIFLAFLPNSPYVLTDIIHLIAKLQMQPFLPSWAILLLWVEFSLYFAIGFGAYVLSLVRLTHYLKRHRLHPLSIPVELTCHFLCAIGIFLGRFQRLNSWNIVTETERVFHRTVADLTNRYTAETIVLIFVIVTVLYYVVRSILFLIVAKK